MKKLKVLLVLFCLLLSGCNSVEIYTGLTENQANLMLSTLLKRGIQAEKASLGKDGYSVSVSSEQTVQALEILHENSLPREDYQNLGTVFSGQSMIASASEEKSRLAYAISQELADTFSRIDGVLNARVHIVLHEVDTVSNVTTEASASVFIRHTPDSSVVNFIPKIKELTAGAVADLEIDNVAVMLVPARDDVTVPPPQQTSGFSFFTQSGSLNFSFIGFALAIALLINALIFGIQIIREKQKNKSLSDNKENE